MSEIKTDMNERERLRFMRHLRQLSELATQAADDLEQEKEVDFILHCTLVLMSAKSFSNEIVPILMKVTQEKEEKSSL